VLTSKAIKKININSASVDEMKSHPYIRYNIANAIFQYRQQHGNYHSVEEIKKIMTINDEIYNKASPYLTVE
jgi:competence ComEA-like helix-hairpin-helix protein